VISDPESLRPGDPDPDPEPDPDPYQKKANNKFVRERLFIARASAVTDLKLNRMGNVLDSPRTEKDSESHTTMEGLAAGSTGMQGWRMVKPLSRLVSLACLLLTQHLTPFPRIARKWRMRTS
jgi:hypothetical protein